MIKLETEYYCHDCPYFEAEIVKIYGDDRCYHTFVRCESDLKCKDLYKRFVAIDKAASALPECDM